jgi:hypothetical protein
VYDGDMKREKIFDSVNVTVYANQPEVGKEADAATDLMYCAFQLAKQFSFHLKEPEKFLVSFRKEMNKESKRLVS